MSRPRSARTRLGRRVLGGAVVAVTLALLAACGGSDGVTPAASGSSAAAADAFPVSLENKYGTTTITKAPQRVVVVGLTEQDSLLALGVVPVATTKWFAENPGEIPEAAVYAPACVTLLSAAGAAHRGRIMELTP